MDNQIENTQSAEAKEVEAQPSQGEPAFGGVEPAEESTQSGDSAGAVIAEDADSDGQPG